MSRHFKKFRYWKARRCKAGENNAATKIGRSVVNYVRENYVPRKVTAPMLARKFGISTGYIRAILRGAYWPGAFGNVGKKALSPENESRIVDLFYSTYSLKQRDKEKWSERRLAKTFGVSKGLVHYILKGKQKGD
jgi:hypothetical protein